MLNDKRYSYDRFSSKGQRVGQAVIDILSRDNQTCTVEEILDEFGRDYLNYIRKIAEDSKDLYESPYFILSLLKKDLGQFGVANVLKHSARPFQHESSVKAKKVVEAHPECTKTLFQVNARTGSIDLVWTIPSHGECISILKSPEIYDPELLKWINQVYSGTLD
jgi:hypothetical protein